MYNNKSMNEPKSWLLLPKNFPIMKLQGEIFPRLCLLYYASVTPRSYIQRYHLFMLTFYKLGLMWSSKPGYRFPLIDGWWLIMEFWHFYKDACSPLHHSNGKIQHVTVVSLIIRPNVAPRTCTSFFKFQFKIGQIHQQKQLT